MNTQVEQALEDLKAGGAVRAERALESLASSAYSFAMKVCGNVEDAQDISQETMMRLAPALGRFENPRALGVWLYKVARTRCLMSRRASKFAPRRTLSLSQLMPSSDHAQVAAPWPENPETIVLKEELRKQLEDAVRLLPEPYRLVLVLRDMEQLDTRETARVLRISPATVKMRLHRARMFMRNTLDSYFRSADDSSKPKKNGRPKV
jgi:RNA polymerase sigma-70 factor (ECF subfamily)